MEWDVTFEKDKDKDDVGTVTAIALNLPDLEPLFVYTKRINGKEEALSFVAEAKQAFIKHNESNTKNDQIATAIKNKLNQ